MPERNRCSDAQAKLRPEMAKAIERLKDLPTDINPVDLTADAIAPPER